MGASTQCGRHPAGRPAGTSGREAPAPRSTVAVHNQVFDRPTYVSCPSSLAEHTRRTYRSRVAQFLDWLAHYECESGDPLADPARDYAVRDYKRHLKTQRKLAASTVNLTLAAIDHFYRRLGLQAAEVRREDLPSLSSRALDEDEQRHLLRALERPADARDKALVMLALYAGLRLVGAGRPRRRRRDGLRPQGSGPPLGSVSRAAK